MSLPHLKRAGSWCSALIRCCTSACSAMECMCQHVPQCRLMRGILVQGRIACEMRSAATCLLLRKALAMPQWAQVHLSLTGL